MRRLRPKKIKPTDGLNAFMHDLFDLHEDKERETKTIQDISKGVEFKGTNLWILIFAIIIASIGLNVNSAAVIIGAMLISPLMGPIMGIGLGAGINDLSLIRLAFKNLLVAVVISVLTSAAYFSISPLHEAHSELLARTYPTLWDVMIAFFGGLAGIIAGSRKERTNAIPGVAIATALMPPLCTAGYGLANANWYFFFGACYLFCINSVFISVATFMIVRFLKYPKKQFDDHRVEVRVKRIIAFLTVITIAPSIYLAYNLVQRTLFEQNAKTFVDQEFDFKETEVINWDHYFEQDSAAIEVTLYGKPLDSIQVATIQRQLPVFNLDNKTNLVIHQGYHDDLNLDQEFEKMTTKLKVEIIEDLYKNNEEVIASKDEQIKLLENELIAVKGRQYPVKDISEELMVHYPGLTQFSLADQVIYSMDSLQADTMCYAMLQSKKRLRTSDLKTIKTWLEKRLDQEKVEVVVF